jgi:protein tyrosine kinase modulator
MELSDYWKILRRHWWIPALLLVLVSVFSLATYHAPAPVYTATLRLTIGVSANRNVEGVDPILTAYQASEYIRDDFVEVLHSEMFANDVNATLNDPNLHISKDNISAAVEKQRRIMSVTITWGNPDQARTIASAAAKTLATENAKYFQQLGSEGATVTVFDGPDVAPVGQSLREKLDIPIKLALALAVGVMLAFFADYLDDTVHDAHEVESLGLRVLGEIPRQ